MLDKKTLSNEERIQIIRSDWWVNYPVAQDAISRLDDLITYPPRDRMPCLLIYGSTGMGKTKIIQKFVRKHPPAFDRAVGNTFIPVVACQMPATPDEGIFYSEICRTIGAPSLAGRTLAKERILARDLLQKAGTKILIVDEIHSMLAGTARAQKIFLNTLRFLANDIRIPLVCAGTEEARLAILTDSQLAERFDALELTRWKNDPEFARLLVTIAANLPLRKKIHLDTNEAREIILEGTDGVTVRIFRLIESAAIQAIKDGTESITEESLASRKLTLPLVSMTRSRGAPFS